MDGIKAVANALEGCGVASVYAVPGYPITGLAEHLIAQVPNARWVINEKSAFEMAFGRSVCGERTCVLVKHVGMNVLSDALITSATHTIGAGLVVMAGDDPLAVGSQNEQDSRYYGLISELAVFDPTPHNLVSCIAHAYVLSERTQAPTIIRLTSRLLEARCQHESVSIPREPPAYEHDTWSLTLHGKHERFYMDAYPVMRSMAEHTPLNTFTQRGGDVVVVSSGYASHVVEGTLEAEGYGDVSHLSLSLVNPLPAGLLSKALSHRLVLVVEEPYPFIEHHIALHPNVRGRTSGHIASTGVSEEDVARALEHIETEKLEPRGVPESLEARGYRRHMCEGCPFLPLLDALREIDAPVAGDVGCIIRAAPEPMAALDVALVLGSAVGVAAGFPRGGIAVIGDFAMLHSALPSLVHARAWGHNMVVVVLKNSVAAITGGQRLPELELLDDALRGICPDVHTVRCEMLGKEEWKKLLSSLLKKGGLSVVVAEGTCPENAEGMEA